MAPSYQNFSPRFLKPQFMPALSIVGNPSDLVGGITESIGKLTSLIGIQPVL